MRKHLHDNKSSISKTERHVKMGAKIQQVQLIIENYGVRGT